MVFGVTLPSRHSLLDVRVMGGAVSHPALPGVVSTQGLPMPVRLYRQHPSQGVGRTSALERCCSPCALPPRGGLGWRSLPVGSKDARRRLPDLGGWATGSGTATRARPPRLRPCRPPDFVVEEGGIEPPSCTASRHVSTCVALRTCVHLVERAARHVGRALCRRRSHEKAWAPGARRRTFTPPPGQGLGHPPKPVLPTVAGHLWYGP